MIKEDIKEWVEIIGLCLKNYFIGRRWIVSSMRKVLILTCFLMIALSTTVMAGENRVLQIDTHGNVYANLYRNVEFPEDVKILTLQYKIRNKDLTSSSWGPAAFLYWDNLDAKLLSI